MYMNDGSGCFCHKCMKEQITKKKNLIRNLEAISIKQEENPHDCDFYDDVEKAEKLLIDYLDDSEIKVAFDAVQKWYT